MKKSVIFLSVCSFWTLGWYDDANAQYDYKDIAGLEVRIRMLEERVKRLEHGVRPLKSTTKEVARVNASGWRSKVNWRLLQKGMTKDQVRDILGAPSKISSQIQADWWYYKDGLDGNVMFYDNRLVAWDEP